MDGAGGPTLTFAWLDGAGTRVGSCHYHSAFSFCDTQYNVGDHVYLTPEDAGAPLYLARLTAAYEDEAQQGGDRLCIEVQWYERRGNMPAHLQPGMHDREVVEWLQTDPNLVGCIERKARVIKARSYEEALAQLTPQEAAGEWHFCRGVLEVDSEMFRTYDEVAADPAYGLDAQTGQVVRLDGGGGLGARHRQQQLAGGEPRGSPTAKRGSSGGGGSQRRRAGGGGGGGGGTSWDAAYLAAIAAGGRPPRPGVSCFQCGQKQTPQWREGPAGPRTLCNACGMRYQRSQGKCITRPKAQDGPNSHRGGTSDFARGGTASPHRAPKRPAGGGGARRSARGAKRGRGSRGARRDPWGGDTDDDDYDPAVERWGGAARGGYGSWGDGSDGEEDGEGDVGAADGAEDGGLGDYGFPPGGGFLAPQLVPFPAFGVPPPGAVPLGPQDLSLLAPGGMAADAPLPVPVPVAPPAPVSATDLQSLVERAAAVAPEVAPLAGVLSALPPGALEALPPDQSALLAGLKAGVEAGLSDVKAADAAVAAVSRVLEQKKEAAARAHEAAVSAAAEFRALVAGLVDGGEGDAGTGGEAAAAAAAAAGPGEEAADAEGLSMEMLKAERAPAGDVVAADAAAL